MRNKLGDRFAKCLQKALAYDKYVKAINLAGNLISQTGLKMIIKLALIENTSIIAFDALRHHTLNDVELSTLVVHT